jgi:hypothetical protein
MLSGVLEPGATLQFWVALSDLENMRARTLGGPASGHSPIFFRYTGPAGNPTGFEVLDDNGTPQACTVVGGALPPTGPPWGAGSRKVRWDNYTPAEAWIAANWIG